VKVIRVLCLVGIVMQFVIAILAMLTEATDVARHAILVGLLLCVLCQLTYIDEAIRSHK